MVVRDGMDRDLGQASPVAQPEVDLGKLLGRDALPRDEPAAQEPCSRAFSKYTGLPGPTPELYPSGVTLLGAPPGTSWALCLTGSPAWRTTTSRDIAR